VAVSLLSPQKHYQKVSGIRSFSHSLVTVLPAPKSRVRVLLNALLFSMSTENFILAFGRGTPVWCFGAVLGWVFISVMSANMDVLFRTKISIEMQVRVYSARKALQFFTIPLGYLCGGLFIFGSRIFRIPVLSAVSGRQTYSQAGK